MPGGPSDPLRPSASALGEPPRMEGGADRRQQRAANPPAAQLLLSLRPANVTAEDISDNRAQMERLRDQFPDDYNDNLAKHALERMIDRELDLDSDENWKAVYGEVIDEEGRLNIRTLGDEPFIDQVNHVIKLCGLKQRNWNMIIHTVVYDDSEAYAEKVAKMFYACRYQGFDPSVLLRKIIKSWRDGNRVPGQSFNIQYETDGVQDTWTYSNKMSLITDMTFLIIIFLNRGAVVEKICKKSSADFTAVLRMLIAKYNIRANEGPERRRRAEALGPEVVTLPRIAACFSQLTTNLFVKGHGKVIISKSDFPEDCSQAIFSPMFPSVVRRGYIEGGNMINIHPQLVLIAVLLDNVIHSRDRVTPLDQIWTYYLASLNSGVIIPEARIRQCDILRVTFDGKFDNRLLAIRNHCIDRIRTLRPHDRMFDFINEMNTLP